MLYLSFRLTYSERYEQFSWGRVFEYAILAVQQKIGLQKDSLKKPLHQTLNRIDRGVDSTFSREPLSGLNYLEHFWELNHK